MRTDPRTLTVLLRSLRSYVGQVTERADAEAREAGLTVETLAGGVRRYRDPRLDSLAVHRNVSPADVWTSPRCEDAAWSTPTLTVSAAMAGAGWSR